MPIALSLQLPIQNPEPNPIPLVVETPGFNTLTIDGQVRVNLTLFILT